MKKPTELERSGFAFIAELERKAHECAANGDIHGTHFIVDKIRATERLIRHLSMRFGGNEQ